MERILSIDGKHRGSAMKITLHQLPSLPRIIVLMYHRIDETDTDPWGICVSPRHFEEQIRFLKNNYNAISTSDVINAVRTNSITDNSICITFDDGYADNYLYAKPILEKYNCPAAFFIATAFLNAKKPFWWDELEMILLHSKQLPNRLCLLIAGQSREYYFNENELSAQQWQQHKTWKWYEAPPTDRCAAFLKIWERLRPLPDEAIQQQMEKISNWAGNNNTTLHRLPMNEQQLRGLAKNDLFTIGLHTHTHVSLKEKSTSFQKEEILHCKKILQQEYNIEGNSLAYPYGRYDNNTIAAVNELNLAACFTTEAVSIDIYSGLMRLGRYQAGDWNMPYFKEQLASWIK